MTGLFDASGADLREQDPGGWRLVRVAVERGFDGRKTPRSTLAQPADGPASGNPGRRSDSGAFTYKTRDPLPVGRRVEVPLGRSNTPASGIVVASGGIELAQGFPLERIKPVLRDEGSALTPELVELAQWMAEYYVCPLGMVLGTMMPAAVKKQTGLRLVTMIDRRELPEEELKQALELLTPGARRAWSLVSALDDRSWPMSPADAMLALGTPTMAPINRLLKAGLLREIDAENIRAVGGVPTQMGIEQAAPDAARDDAPQPTPDQARVIEGVSGTLGAFRVHLLRGVTGSGKTEVYLRVLERVLRRGSNALVLVPEIALTPQTAGRFVRRFSANAGTPAGVAVLHSGLTQTQRHREWRRVESGEARVVVGARSAIFAPVGALGLVIVDEEHASDYKQDQLPRYHGRDVAIKRAQLAGCPVLLGSATPSLESWANAAPAQGREGKYALWELTGRVGGARLPHVEIVDLNTERALRQRGGRRSPGAASNPPGTIHLLGPTLEAAIASSLDDAGQVLLLLNRRGYACYVACAGKCGFVLDCEHCDARMVQHRVVAGKPPPKGLLRCHHCLAQVLLPGRCPQCGGPMVCLGLGTQRVEEELQRKFGARFSDSTGEDGARWLLRVDGDTMHSAKDYFGALSRFARGEVRVLLGTQMIAKGLDFPNVRLVGVINADTALWLPDFRAGERTFQLVSQVAGRAGRGSLPGRVIVQTMEPDAPAIRHAAAHDYLSFAQEELSSRGESGLPPIARMARIVLRDEDATKLQQSAQTLFDALSLAIRELGDRASGVRLMPPAPCPISRIAGFHRVAIELFADRRMALQSVLQRVRARGLLKSDARTAVDIDPIALM